ncbi:MAG: mechanosensitive ion channel domain-containing protein [Pseudomonadota bacterium]
MENEDAQPVLMECFPAPDGGAQVCRPAEVDGASTEPLAAGTEEAGSGLFSFMDPILADPLSWVQANLLNLDILLPILYQVGAILAVLVIGSILAPRVRAFVSAGLERLPEQARSFLGDLPTRIVRPALWAAGLFIAQALMAGGGFDSAIVRIASSLSLAVLGTSVVIPFLPKAFQTPVRWVIYAFAAFYALGVINQVMAVLGMGPTFGGRPISPLFIIQAVVTAGLFLYGAHWLSRKLKTRVEELPKVEPSLRILLSNALQIGLFFAAALLTMAGLQIPMSGLAVLGGAIGVGLGFGMQQIIANFISGVILLSDRSIKPDDVIEVDETYGVVKSLGLRYASVVTRDGKEHLIPNEMLITDKVVNWSYSNKEVRVKRRLRVEYETDLRQAVGLVVEGAKKTPRVLAKPAPVCLVMEFGDEAIEIEARFWINDPENGVSNVSSAVMLNIWDLFKEAGIDIPLRHEDVLITPGSTLKVEMVKSNKKETA